MYVCSFVVLLLFYCFSFFTYHVHVYVLLLFVHDIVIYYVFTGCYVQYTPCTISCFRMTDNQNFADTNIRNILYVQLIELHMICTTVC